MNGSYPLTNILSNLAAEHGHEISEFSPDAVWFFNAYHEPPDILLTIVVISAIVLAVGGTLFSFTYKKGEMPKARRIAAWAGLIIAFIGAVPAVCVSIVALGFLAVGYVKGEVDLQKFEKVVETRSYDVDSITIMGKDLRVYYNGSSVFYDVNIDDSVSFTMSDRNVVNVDVDGFFNAEWPQTVEVTQSTVDMLHDAYGTLTIYPQD